MSQSPKKTKSSVGHLILTGALVLAGVGLVARFIMVKMNGSVANKTADQVVECGTETQSFEMKDNYMRGHINRGEMFEVSLGHYACHPIERGDLVLFQISQRLDPVAKVVRAIAGDKISLEKNEEKKRWQIRIAGELLKFNDKPFLFGRIASIPPLAKYIEKHQGIVQEGDVVIFSAIPPGIQDSGTFGPVLVKDMVGKIIKTNVASN